MNLILIGAPGVGKGTQAQLIMGRYKIPQISTGDILRAEIKKKTDLGSEVDAILKKGELVPDETMLKIIKKRLNEPDCKSGFILDGFPRTIQQAESLDRLLKELNSKQLTVINIDVPEDVIIDRLSSRRVCVKCGKTYNLMLNSLPQDGKCGVCGGEIIQRNDDKEETIRNRLMVYKDKTQPLIEFYRKKGSLHEVNGKQTIRDVFNDIDKIIRFR
jgi:adenylate kinase